MVAQPPMPATGYGPPQPYYQKELDTLKGLKHINWGIILYIVATLLLLLAALLVVLTIPTIIEAAEPEEFLGVLAAAGGLACGGLVLFLVTIILFLLGIYEMYTGKEEFGPGHSTKVSRAILMIVLYIVLVIITFVATLGMAFSGATTSTDVDEYLESLRMTVIISGVLGIISSAVFGLAVVFLIVELCDEGWKRILWMAFALFMVLTIVGFAIAVWTVYQDFSDVTDVDELVGVSSIADLARGLSFIPFIMFLLCYRHAYSRVRSGAIQPVVTPYQQQMWPMPPPPAAYPPAGPPGRVCPSCGSPVSPGEAFCANCGARLQG